METITIIIREEDHFTKTLCRRFYLLEKKEANFCRETSSKRGKKKKNLPYFCALLRLWIPPFNKRRKLYGNGTEDWVIISMKTCKSITIFEKGRSRRRFSWESFWITMGKKVDIFLFFFLSQKKEGKLPTGTTFVERSRRRQGLPLRNRIAIALSSFFPSINYLASIGSIGSINLKISITHALTSIQDSNCTRTMLLDPIGTLFLLGWEWWTFEDVETQLFPLEVHFHSLTHSKKKRTLLTSHAERHWKLGSASEQTSTVKRALFERRRATLSLRNPEDLTLTSSHVSSAAAFRGKSTWIMCALFSARRPWRPRTSFKSFEIYETFVFGLISCSCCFLK